MDETQYREHIERLIIKYMGQVPTDRNILELLCKTMIKLEANSIDQILETVE